MPGVYLDAQDSFGSPTKPGIEVGRNIQLCQQEAGSFAVLEVSYGPDSLLSSLAVDFEHRCFLYDGTESSTLFGTIRFNSDVPVDEPTPVFPTRTPTPAKYPIVAGLYSQEQDYIGAGQTSLLTPADGLFALEHDLGHVAIDFDGGGRNSFTFDFAAPLGMELLPGVYESVRKYPQPPRRPGLGVAGAHRACNDVTGRFVVLEAQYDSAGDVQRFAADFEQHCEGAPAALFGYVRINSDQPTPAPPAATPTPRPDSSTLEVGALRFNAASGSFYAFHHPGSVNVQYAQGEQHWSFNFVAPRCADVLPGIYNNATGYPFGDPNGPRLNVDGPPPLGCASPVAGQFTVKKAEYGDFGHVEAFEVEYDASCAAAPGRISYHSTAPTATPASPTPTPSDLSTFAAFESDRYDYIGACVKRRFTLAEGIFTATVEPRAVVIDFVGDQRWRFVFAAPPGVELTPGVYEGATRYPVNAGSEPGMDVSGDGRGCNGLDGRFEVLELERGADGEIARFAATFEQHCEHVADALRGVVRFNSTLETPTPLPTATPAGPLGDANCDGEISAADVVAIEMLIGVDERADCKRDDANLDGHLDSEDVDTATDALFGGG